MWHEVWYEDVDKPGAKETNCQIALANRLVELAALSNKQCQRFMTRMNCMEREAICLFVLVGTKWKACTETLWWYRTHAM